MKNCFIISSFGDRKHLVDRLAKNIRKFWADDILLYTDENRGYDHKNFYVRKVRSMWPAGSRREHHRNTDYYPVAAVRMEIEYDSFCCLDDDMHILRDSFGQGFLLAQRFGLVLPMNPRVYVLFDSMGEDVSDKVRWQLQHYCVPAMATAVNFSPMFINRKVDKVKDFVDRYLWEIIDNTCRGPIALWKAFWMTKLTPFILPETWCVCGKNSKFWKEYKLWDKDVPVVCLHLGHKEVQDVWGFEDE